MKNITYLAYLSLAACLLAWVGVAYFASTISSDELARAAAIETMQQSSMKGASTVRTHALAQETQGERAMLDQLLSADVVGIANMIEAAGKAAGVKAKLGDAQFENTPSADQGPKINAVGFVVQAEGKFSALMQATQLLESLPAPSSVQRLDIEKTPGSASWHMNAYIRVLTTADISS